MREKVLALLRGNQEQYVSGEDISKGLSVSRTAVWKHIQALRALGYDIEAHSRLGYKLLSVPELLLPDEIRNGLTTKVLGCEMIHYYDVDSTNLKAKALASQGCPEGTIVVSEAQSKGRGRLARNWFSPTIGGIWSSIVLRPPLLPMEASKFTFVAAVAVARAIIKTTGLAARIKWPNDILVNHKKAVGILTEMHAEPDAIDYIVIGIGINVNVPIDIFPDIIKPMATSLAYEAGHTFDRVRLLQVMLCELEEVYSSAKTGNFEAVFEAWRSLSGTIGNQVDIYAPDRAFSGLATDIDQDGALLVKTETGIERVIAGDVSVRPRV